MTAPAKNSILIVDDERANIIALTHMLSQDYKLYAAKNGRHAVELAKKHLPDIIMLDILMPDVNGFEVLTVLKRDEDTKDIPVIFVTGLNNEEDEEKGLELGAADYITKPFRSSIVKLRVGNQIKIINQIETIKHMSVTDQLTGISNRRHFDIRLSLEWNHAKREQMPLSLLMVDIDHFKAYNDNFGHLQGDVALREVAAAIKGTLSRSVDFVSRWGGEEFAVLLSGTGGEGAVNIAERIRQCLEAAEIPCGNSTTKITVSIGANTTIPFMENDANNEKPIDDFLLKADKALYKAKSLGRNRVCLYEEA